MNIDFHYGMIFVVSRLAGMSENDAKSVAHACQYVDDATVNGILEFAGGETFERFSSAHKMFDYHNMLNDQNRLVWAPFHFLPGGKGNSLEEKAICLPNSDIARTMIRRAIDGRGADNALHRLGISLHVYVDTWAHQGFSGIISKYNTLTSLVGDDHDHTTWTEKLKGYLVDAGHNVATVTLDLLSKLGHGAALHFPDMPWAKWKYTNGHGDEIHRDNLPDFMAAANMASKVVQAFLAGEQEFELQPGLTAEQLSVIEQLLASNQEHDEEKRLNYLVSEVAAGKVPGVDAIPAYIAKGPGSWKHEATGIEDQDDDGHAKPIWSARFENSHYRKFHDAIKQHRYVVTQQILPDFQLRIA